MLKFLAINNIVLIDEVEIDFENYNNGLCVLSGETGSGKSILLDAFGLAIGFRSSLRLIGANAAKASVLAEFDISQNEECRRILLENDLICEETPDLLRIRRVLTQKSGSKVYVNDEVIGVTLLAKLGETLVEIHGQHDSRGLLDSAFHEVVLDRFAQNEDLLTKTGKIYTELREIEAKINEIEEKKQQALREKDYLEFIIKELDDANIKKGEEDELKDKKDLLKGQEKIADFLNGLRDKLSAANGFLSDAQGSIIHNKDLAQKYLTDRIADFDGLSQDIDKQTVAIDDFLQIIKEIERDFEIHDDNIDEIDKRLFEIRTLARKFNVTSDELSKIIDDAHEKLSLIEGESDLAQKLLDKKEKLRIEFDKNAAKLHEKRAKSGIELAKKVESELKFLKMENVKFWVKVEKQDNLSASGFDKVRFFASINHNDFDEIVKIASGGELSRFMLALKVALIDVKSCPALIFDEIDTGIGGVTANAVGDRLKELSRNFQVFVVTHQPQIAAKSDLHFRISKSKNENKIKTTIEKLEKEGKTKEVARMISGEKITQESLAAAKKLIQ